MGYIHKGKVSIIGTVDPDSILIDAEELKVYPEDDGLQIVDYVKGDLSGGILI
jgi:hypothetical protein